MTVSVFAVLDGELMSLLGTLSGSTAASRRRSSWAIVNVTANGSVFLNASTSYALVFGVSSSTDGTASIALASGIYPQGSFFVSNATTANDAVFSIFMGLMISLFHC